MSSQSDLVGGEQNGQTSQPLVANQNHQSPGTDQKCRARKRVNAKNDQNVKSKADGKKKAKSPGKDQRYRARIRQGIEKMERQLEEARKENADLKITNAFSNGKLAQALLDMDLIKGYVSQMKEEVTQNTARVNRLQQLVLAGTIFGPTMGPLPQSHQVERAHVLAGTIFGPTMGPLPQSHQVERAHWYNVEQPGDWTYNGDVNYTSLPGAAIASGSSLMQGSLAPVEQGNNSEQPTPYNADQFRGVN